MEKVKEGPITGDTTTYQLTEVEWRFPRAITESEIRI